MAFELRRGHVIWLVRKQNLRRAGGSGRRPAALPELGGLAGYGDWQGAGVGVEGFDGDLLAEPFDGADVVAGLAADVHPPFVKVPATIPSAGTGISHLR